jgi:acyl-CoA thioesterase-2
MQASFHTEERGFEHQFPMPDVPGPDTIKPMAERLLTEFGGNDEWFKRQHPIDQRFIGELPWSSKHNKEPRQQLWIRADGELPRDPLLHACVVTYASDMSLFDAILAPHSMRWDGDLFMGASLDHCMWFHRELHADEWLLYDIDSPIAHAGRGLARGFIYNRSGELCVSMVQEGLTRIINPAHHTRQA